MGDLTARGRGTENAEKKQAKKSQRPYHKVKRLGSEGKTRQQHSHRKRNPKKLERGVPTFLPKYQGRKIGGK